MLLYIYNRSQAIETYEIGGLSPGKNYTFTLDAWSIMDTCGKNKHGCIFKDLEPLICSTQWTQPQESEGILSVPIIATISAFLVLIIGGLVAVLIYWKKCIGQARTPKEETEMHPVQKTGNPIARGQFREVMKGGNIPDEDEFAKLNQTDQRQNVLGKSKSVAQDFSISKNPLNR